MAATAGAVRAGAAYIEASLDTSKLNKGLAQVQSKLTAFSAQVGAIGGSLVALEAGIVAPLVAAAVSFAKAGDELDKLAQRTGATVEELSALQFVASQTGTDFGALSDGLQNMNRRLAEAELKGGATAEALKSLNLSAEQLNRLPTADRLRAIAEQISKLPDAGKQSAAAFKIFGGASKQLLPLLQQGESGIAALIHRAEELGVVMSEEDRKAAVEFTDAMDELTKQLGATKNQIGVALVPTLIDLTKKLGETLTKSIEWIKNNKELIAQMFDWGKKTLYVGASLIALNRVMGIIIATLRTLRTITMAAAGAKAFLLGLSGPAGLGIVAAAAITAGVAVYGVNRALDNMVNSAKSATGAAEKTAEAIDRIAESSRELRRDLQQAFQPVETSADKLRDKLEEIEELRKRAMTPDGTVFNRIDAVRQFDPEAADRLTQQLNVDMDRMPLNEAVQKTARDAAAIINEAFDGLEQAAVASATGIDRELKGMEDEIRKLRGEADDTAIAMERLAAAGVPDEQLKKYRQVADTLKEIREEKKEQERAEREAEREAERTAAGIADLFQSLTDELEDVSLEPLEREIRQRQRQLERMGGTEEHIEQLTELMRRIQGLRDTEEADEARRDSFSAPGGTFSQLAPQMFGTGAGGPLDDIAETNKKIERNTRKMSKRDGLAFGA